MAWFKVHIKALINGYKEHPCLYHVKSDMYHNKHARQKALEDIRDSLRNAGITVTIQEIKNKFNNLRTNFMSQHKKYLGSIKSGMGTSEISKPNLWYYDAMMFLLDHANIRSSIDSLSQSKIVHNLIPAQNDECSLNYEESQDLPQDLNIDMEINDKIAEKQTAPMIRLHSVGTVKPPIQDLTINNKEDEMSGPSTSYERAMSTPTNYMKNAKNERIKVEDFDEQQIMTPMTTTFTDIKNAIVECPSKNRSSNDIFGELVAAELDFFQKEDSEIYIDVQEAISGVIWSAKRKLLNLRK